MSEDKAFGDLNKKTVVFILGENYIIDEKGHCQLRRAKNANKI